MKSGTGVAASLAAIMSSVAAISAVCRLALLLLSAQELRAHFSRLCAPGFWGCPSCSWGLASGNSVAQSNAR